MKCFLFALIFLFSLSSAFSKEYQVITENLKVLKDLPNYTITTYKK